MRKPSEWSYDTQQDAKFLVGAAAVVSVIATIIGLLAAIHTGGFNTDHTTKAHLLKAWQKVQSDEIPKDGVYLDWKHIKDKIGSNQDFTTKYGVGPAAILNESRDNDTILVDVHTRPKLLVLYAHSGTGRDFKLEATPNGQPVITDATPEGTHIVSSWHHRDWWLWLRWVARGMAALWAGIVALFTFLWVGGTISGILRKHRKNKNPRVGWIAVWLKGRQEKAAREAAARRAAVSEAEALERWAALVGRTGQYGPMKPEAGHEVLIAAKRENAGQLSFALDVYRWNPSSRDWHIVTGEVEPPAIPEKFKDQWTGNDDLAGMSEAWFDFCAWVDKLNRARWAAIAGEHDQVQAQSALPAGSLSALLPSVSTIIEDAPAGVDALASVRRAQSSAK